MSSLAIESSDSLKSMLFPTKQTSRTKHSSSSVADSLTEGRDPKPNGHTDDDAGNPSIRWVGLTPLQMVEEIASMAEANMKLADRRSAQPLRVDTSFLAAKTPELPHPPAVQRNAAPTPPIRASQSEEDYKVKVEENESTVSDCPSEQHSGHKRVRCMSDVDGYEYQENITSTSSLGTDHTTISSLPPWDPSYIIHRDPDPLVARDFADKLSTLAVQLEALPAYGRCLPSYKRIRDHLALSSEWIHRNSATPSQSGATDSARPALDNLYRGTVQKMEALVEMALTMAAEEEQESKANGPAFGVPIEAVAPSPIGSSPPPPPPPRAAKKERSKKGFAEYMNAWLRENWTNPYPDDDGLVDLADACGTTPAVVSNWLINARTRKWRPAIVKAYETGRPADLLREDAINIFDGKPLRKIEGLQIIHTPPLSGKRKGEKGNIQTPSV